MGQPHRLPAGPQGRTGALELMAHFTRRPRPDSDVRAEWAASWIDMARIAARGARLLPEDPADPWDERYDALDAGELRELAEEHATDSAAAREVLKALDAAEQGDPFPRC
jgi:hypothetical protein